MTETERWLLCLSHVPGLGERGLDTLLGAGILLPRLFELPAEELQGRFGLSARAAAALAAGAQSARARVAPFERLVLQHGIRILMRGTDRYPPLLARTEEAPPLLFAYGELAILKQPGVAFLSSNGESRAGLERTAALAGHAARAGLAVVAGHDRPGYRAALSAAKAEGGRSLIVLDRGLLDAFGDDLYRDLFPAARVWGYAFDRERSLVLSPYPIPARFAGLRNRRRDQMVACLAERIIAVEVRRGGVMERECRAARARGTPVHVCAGTDAPEGNCALLTDGFPPLPDEGVEFADPILPASAPVGGNTGDDEGDP